MSNWRWRQLKTLTAVACVTCACVAFLASWPSPSVLPATAASASSRSTSSSSSAAAASSSHAPAAAARIAASMPAPTTVAVVGSGLAGLAAAYELSVALQARLPEAQMVLFEKNAAVGGNSAKASSGINAINMEQGDTPAAFAADTLQSGGGLSAQELVHTLVEHSVEGLAFLQALGPNLSTVVRLGGHSHPRTHSNPSGPNVGFVLISAVAGKVKAAANVRVLTNTQVLELHAMEDGRLSIMYTSSSQRQQQQPAASAAAAAAPTQPFVEEPGLPAVLTVDALVLATGGFGANRAMLKAYSTASEPLADLPTTNGPWATGDGLKLGQSLGAELVGMEHVQVHPTGFVDPADPQAGTKWLAPEKLRGCGALLLNSSGQRFVDELSTRDKVADALMQQEGRGTWVLLGAAGAAMFGEATLGFYASKGMVTKFESLARAAAHMRVPLEVLQQEVERYSSAAAAVSAAASGSSSSDAFGKRFFPSTIDAAAAVWVGQVTPVVHYTMGGLRVNAQAQVLRADGSAIQGLYAAGEVSGGLHGANRLGGNSLAECVVFGRIAGQQAARHVLPANAAAGVATPALL